MDLETEVYELRTVIRNLRAEVVTLSEQLYGVIEYVNEEHTKPVGCGFACTNNSVTLR